MQAVGDHPLIQPGGTCPLDEAYCRRTIELDSPLAVQDANASSAISETAIETFDLGTYIGAKLTVNNEPYGTICFADKEERGTTFSDAETHFVELLAHLAGNAIERRTYEQELEEREARLDEREEEQRALIDASFDLVFRIDTDGQFTFISDTAEDLLGYTPEELVDRPFSLLLPDNASVELATETYEQALAGQSVEEEYLVVESKTGDQVVLDVRKVPIYESTVPKENRTTADIVGVQGAAKAATERFHRERLNHVLNRVLRHNLRNDMNVIGGFSEVLEKRLSGENAELAERINRTSDRLSQLSESARKLSENMDLAPELEPMDITPMVERAASQITERYPDADITVKMPSKIVAQSTLSLETAVWELLDNAAKHAGDYPEVSVEVTTIEDRVAIRIFDDGPGLPPSERSVLTTGEETPLVHGQGLGLWLVYWIIEGLNGDLQLHNDDPRTCIELRLHAGEVPSESSGE
ncbi:ATP-binding protein [Halorubrum lacusprofundi]|uniref:ATP-binding protein n=1 Tax=Halorubrum lacusprofundi TaxID=2247 RepID=UPI001F498DF9|nr:ATP-binding protein [Halorubrum lacusprofundi]